MLRPNKDFSLDETKMLFDRIADNFNVKQVHAFKLWYNGRYFSKEQEDIIHLLPKIIFFEIRRVSNGTMSIILSTSSKKIDKVKDFHNLILIDKYGAFNNLDLKYDDKENLKNSIKIYEHVIDESVIVYTK